MALISIALAVVGIILVAAGSALLLPAAGVIVAGVELVGAAYVVAYIGGRK